MARDTNLKNPRRGLTLVEILLMIDVAALVLPLVLSELFHYHHHRDAPTLRCATQLKQIHQAWVMWGEDHAGQSPLPTKLSSTTAEKSVNSGDSTANLHSIIIFNGYMDPDVVVCPGETNPNIVIDDDYDRGGPDSVLAETDQWDWRFRCDIDGANNSWSNVSYANWAPVGDRVATDWWSTLDSHFPVFGDRGPKDGIPNRESLSYQNHGSGHKWKGNVVFADGHVPQVTFDKKSENPFILDGAVWLDAITGQEMPDNLFANDDKANGSDTWLGVFRRSDESGAIPIWD